MKNAHPIMQSALLPFAPPVSDTELAKLEAELHAFELQRNVNKSEKFHAANDRRALELQVRVPGFISGALG